LDILILELKITFVKAFYSNLDSDASCSLGISAYEKILKFLGLTNMSKRPFITKVYVSSNNISAKFHGSV
jgi:hypothetical protein